MAFLFVKFFVGFLYVFVGICLTEPCAMYYNHCMEVPIMYVHFNDQSDDRYYYLTKCIRIGKKTRTITVRTLGKHSELLKEHEDPLAYCKQIASEETRQEKEKQKNNQVTVLYDMNEPLKRSSDRVPEHNLLNTGYLYLQKILSDLKLDIVFEKIRAEKKIRYDIQSIFNLLVFSRILYPASKRSTVENSKLFYGVNKPNDNDVYRSLDLISEYAVELQKQMYKASSKIVDRNTEVLYYDCTNYYFETEREDPDILNDDGDIIQYGLRKYGKSKENRPNPIVGQGLFIDGNGIPIAQTIYHGNMNEQLSTLPLERKIVKQFGLSSFIYCSDSGLGSLNTKLYNTYTNRHFVVAQSLKKVTADEHETIFKDLNWKLYGVKERKPAKYGDNMEHDVPVSLETFKNAVLKEMNGEALTDEEASMMQHDLIYKRVPVKKKLDSIKTKKAGSNQATKDELSYDIIVTFSKKYFKYENSILDRQLERAQKMIDENDLDSYHNNVNDVKRLLKKTQVSKETGEVLDKKQLVNLVEINNEVVNDERFYHGFYAMASNLDYDVESIFDINKQRWMVENCFRLLKSVFLARPVFVSNEARIEGHFITCFTALLVFKLLEFKLNDKITIDKFTSNEIIKALKNIGVLERKEFYESTYDYTLAVERLEQVTNLNMNKKIYTEAGLNKILRSTKK